MILIKAQPHRSSQYFETVCCAGVGRDRKWRRQYPVPFRILKDNQKFGRWQWVSYQFVKPKEDPRRESQKVVSHTLVAKEKMKPSERASFLAPLVQRTLAEADAAKDSLALVRPKRISLKSFAKSKEELAEETLKHKELASQLSLLDSDEDIQPLTPCRMQFRLSWQDEAGGTHEHECDDWETATAFNRFDQKYGEAQAIHELRRKYEQQYFDAGLVLGFSTHKRRNVEYGTRNQWLLVGLIRLDKTLQGDLLV